MYYRRKIILALLQLFDGRLEKIRLQKLLFLVSHNQTKAVYNFIPYKFGCYSYSASADLRTMTNKHLLLETRSHFKKVDDIDYLNQLKTEDTRILQNVKSHYGNMSTNSLMKYTYINYPYYAIKSAAPIKILTSKQLANINAEKPGSEKIILYTIGYEGIALEEYLNRLIKHDVKLLVDVRKNPISMKYGFSKNKLRKYCESLNIQYIHIPEVGIQSARRRELNTQKDYDDLFKSYRIDDLKHTLDEQEKILNLLQKHKRVALTCFEAEINKCHRKHLAESITALPGFTYKMSHI